MSRFEYMKILLQWFSQYVVDQYNIIDFLNKDGFFYANIRKVVYGLKQAACIDFDRLGKVLKPHGYCPLPSNLGFGATRRSQQNLRFLWMILASNTLIIFMLTILSIPQRNTTKYLSIGR